MKRLETVQVTVTYCDVCGNKIEYASGSRHIKMYGVTLDACNRYWPQKRTRCSDILDKQSLVECLRIENEDKDGVATTNFSPWGMQLYKS